MITREGEAEDDHVLSEHLLGLGHCIEISPVLVHLIAWEASNTYSLLFR